MLLLVYYCYYSYYFFFLLLLLFCDFDGYMLIFYLSISRLLIFNFALKWIGITCYRFGRFIKSNKGSEAACAKMPSRQCSVRQGPFWCLVPWFLKEDWTGWRLDKRIKLGVMPFYRHTYSLVNLNCVFFLFWKMFTLLGKLSLNLYIEPIWLIKWKFLILQYKFKLSLNFLVLVF